MTSVLILLSGFDAGTYFIEDDGIAGNGKAQLRGPDGSVIVFDIPTEFLTVSASAGRSIVFNLTEWNAAADITVGNLTNSSENPDSIQIDNIAGADAVTLVANGSITEFATDSAPDVIATSLILSASSGVGTPGNALETQVGGLEAETTTGGINLTNFGNVTVGGLTDSVNGLDVDTSGDLTLTNFGTITAGDLSPGGFESIHGGNTSGNVTLIANGASSDILSNVDQDFIAAPGGNIVLTAGRDVSLGSGGANFDNDVRARGSVTITTGRDFNADGFADIASDGFGAATGGNLVINAGRDINVLNSTGTDASIGAEGSGGADVILTTGPGGFLRLLATSSSSLFSSTGDVTANADRVVISGVSGITASSGTVTLAPVTAGWAVNYGSATDGAFALELSDAESDRIFTPTLILGSNAAGPVTVSAAITLANAPNLVIRSGTDINVQSSITTTTSLQLSALDNVSQLAASTITTPSLQVFVDRVDDDPGVGGIAILNGTVSSLDGIIGNLDSDTLNGTNGADGLLGFAGNDTLRGRGGNDGLDGGAGADTMIGGLGDDVYAVDNGGDVVTEAVGEGTDYVYTSVSYALSPNVEFLLAADPQSTAPLALIGNASSNTIYGNIGNNGIDGGAGADVMIGWGGDDVYAVDNAGDQPTEFAGGGTDYVYTTISYVLPANIEFLLAADPQSTAPLGLTGNASNNIIYANIGNNGIDGGPGADLMYGWGGDDVYAVDNVGDLPTEFAGGGFDYVYASVSYVLTPNIEVLLAANPQDTAPLSLTGNDQGNIVNGNIGNNTLNGGLGGDILTGYGGADTFAFTTALGSGNVDFVVDFQTGIDKIALEDSIFTTLPPGALAAGAFRSGSAAGDADDRIIYDPATGALFYDADGNGAGAAIQFATLQTGLALTVSDFAVI